MLKRLKQSIGNVSVKSGATGLGRFLPSAWVLLPALVVVVTLYYGIGVVLTHKIDADPDFSSGPVTDNQSRTVSVAARLLFREVDRWTPNDPFFVPGWFLDDMPNYQVGIYRAVTLVVDNLAKVTENQGTDTGEALIRASGRLKYPPTIWRFDPKAGWAPVVSAEKQYRRAARDLNAHNALLEQGVEVFPRNGTILVTLARAIGQDLLAQSARIDRYVLEDHSAYFASSSDDLFYDIKGRTYAYGLMLRELGWDHATLLEDAELGAQWRQMLDALSQATQLSPLLVVNGDPDSLMAPSHLSSMGFYMLRAQILLDQAADRLALAAANQPSPTPHVLPGLSQPAPAAPPAPAIVPPAEPALVPEPEQSGT